MHELSLCESVLQVLEQQAKVENYQTVTAVYLEIGALSGVEPDAMRFCFDSVVKGSLAEKAQLEIIEIAGQAWCSACNTNVFIEQRYQSCPNCGSYPLQINDGDQMRIKQLEVA